MNLFDLKRYLGRAVIYSLLTLFCLVAEASAQKMVWQSEIKDAASWEQLSKDIDDARVCKFVLDVKSGGIFFFDSNVFDLHVDFVMAVILNRPQTESSIREFNLNYEADKPEFILGYLTYHKPVNLWSLSFWEGDSIKAADVEKTIDVLKKKFFVKTLRFRPESLSQITMARGLPARGITVITNDEIYRQLEFRALNTGEATGILHIVPPTTPFNELDLKENEIVLLQSLYPDLEPVAGVITTNNSTPLSHVNLRASAWGIPNKV